MACIKSITDGTRVLIGIKGVPGWDTPASNLFINDIEGMSLKYAASVVNSEVESGTQLLKDKIALATRLVFEEFKQYMFDDFAINSVVKIERAGQWLTNFGWNTMYAGDRGLYIRRNNSRIAKIFIKQILIKVNTSGPATVQIYDGSTVTPFTITLVAGTEYKLECNYKADAEEVFIKMDNTTIQTAAGVIKAFNSTLGCHSCGPVTDINSKDLYFAGWNGTGTDEKLFGINADVELLCDEEELICCVLERLYFPIWYRAGIEVYKESLASGRLNAVKLFGTEQAKTILARLEAEYPTKFYSVMKSIVSYLSQFTDLCLKCRGAAYVQSHP
jgi:hypothetical protein